MPETVLLPTGAATASHVERGSRFIATADRCASFEQGLQLRDAERRHTHDATHHVWAIKLANGNSRCDDDGEPAGTGGRPVLKEIETAGVVDAICLVTRYFGGTKLGTGGLARAYGRAAALALEDMPTRRVRRAEIRYVVYRFEDTGIVARVTASHGAVRDGDEFSDSVRTRIRIPVGTGERLAKALVDSTGGRAWLEPAIAPEAAWIASEA